MTQTERVSCPHCRKLIDSHAALCLFCNRDPQAPPEPKAKAAPPPPPPPKSKLPLRNLSFSNQTRRTKAFLAAAVAALLMASFAVGGIFYGLSAPGPKIEGAEEEEVTPQQSDSPADDVAMKPGPPMITSAPPAALTVPVTGTAPVGTSLEQGADATALPAEEYAKIVAAHQRMPAARGFQTVADPRQVTSPLPGVDASRTAAARSEPRAEQPVTVAQANAGRYTRARPISQPIPSFRVDRDGTVRLELTIGTDGRVKEVNVLQGLPGVTPRVIAAVQRWQFRPATRDDQPVEGKFTVDISFNRN